MRRRPVLSSRPLVLLLVAFCGWGANLTKADGNVGCLFSESLCTDKVEWCYDDYAFGKCLQIYGNVEEEDLVRHDLTTEELRAFEHELQRLLLLGYRWSHAYTQCVLQAMLYAIKNRLHYEGNVCEHLADQDLTAALGAFKADEEVDPQSVAFVRFTPNSGLEETDFADEVYFPPSEKDFLANLPLMSEVDMPPDENEETEYESWPQHVKRSYRNMNRRSIAYHQPPPEEDFQVFSRVYNTPGNFREGHETRDMKNLESIYGNKEEFQAIPFQNAPSLSQHEQNIPYAPNSPPLTSDEILYLLQPENKEELRALLPQYIDSSNNGEFIPIAHKDPINTWLENQDLDQLRDALAELKEPFTDEVDPYYVSTSEFLTKNRLRPDRFNQHYNTPDRFRQGYESRDGVVGAKEDNGEILEPRIYIDEDEQDHFRDDSGSGEHDGRADTLRELEYLAENNNNNNEYPPFINMNLRSNNEVEDQQRQAAMLSRLLNTWKSTREAGQMGNQRSGVYTEGGLVYVADSSPTSHPEKVTASQLLGPELGALLADYEWGFRRRERLDVKKPGPPFDINNRHFNHDSDDNHTKTPLIGDSLVAPLMVKKELHEDHEQDADLTVDQNVQDTSYDVDSSYAYVGFKDSIRTWKEGARVVRTIGELLHLEPSAFSYPRVDHNEVTFKVEENSKALNASEVAARIDSIKDDLKKELGVEVTSAGVGDKAKYPAVLRLESSNNLWESWMARGAQNGGTALVAALAAAVAVSLLAGLGILAARHRRRRLAKMRDLSGADTEASRDYQDLCRARMSGKWQAGTPQEKGSTEKHETTGQRITSLSRESDGNSPSTRSSTSSWSEEPALTNMDISTGHMVLTYMEDHLKNKDRLDEEWRALCAYEAEPSATTAAELPDNTSKNRATNVMPYDHARLVLNDVTNMGSSDYINASTITDHDPRNPAYIAAQGPLPHTAPDFWQMVWEQGSVVMVMLTRLTEGGVAMCHRYWPEEGSELYHIYEVHLVSEHIWCDDYLVRSFYLKNLKSGETRTVTQFHFLSWPDRGVPSSTKALLEFRRKVNKSYRGRSCPIVVHCSDGAGRTGTYCLIDMVLNRMAKGAKEIDIAATLEHIRDQRPHMVTTKQQFEFVLMAVAEEVHAILKALPAQLQQQHEKREKELAAEKEKLEKQEKQEK